MSNNFEKRTFTLKEIASVIGGILNEKEENILLESVAPPMLADKKTLALAIQEEEVQNLQFTEAKAAVVPMGVESESISTIEVERPRLAMMKLLNMFYIAPDTPVEIHPTAVVDPTAELGENVSIGPNVCVGRGVKIGNNSKLMANTTVGKFTQIGEDCLFHPGVHIGDFISIGNKVIMHHGVSIGADGFSFATEKASNIEEVKQGGSINTSPNEQVTYKIPSLGSVEIHDDVEIGANTTIDRGTIENTIIGKSTKIDNLTMIGHNCKIGKNCLIVSQVGIAGSCVIGDRVVMAGQVGLADHITIGSDSILMAKSGVSKSYPEKSLISGIPAVDRKEHFKQVKAIKDIVPLMRDLKKMVKQNQES